MDERKFLAFAKEAVVNYFNGRVDSTDKNGKITVDDVFVVWFCKTLQNSKALLSTNVPDGMYYELTYNGDKDEAYLDAYKKWQNITVVLRGADDETDSPCEYQNADIAMPSAQPTAERVGHWVYKKIDEKTGIEDHEFCSECGFPRAQIYDKFCAVCGARMEG